MDDNEGAEEYPQKHVNHVRNLDSPYEIYYRSEQMRIPEEEAGYNLDGNKRRHNEKIRHLLHGVKLIANSTG